MNKVLNEVRSRFLAEAQIKLRDISATPPADFGNVVGLPKDNPLFIYAHRVSGVARTLGFEVLGEKARSLEDKLESFFQDPLDDTFPDAALDDFLEELAFAVSSN